MTGHLTGCGQRQAVSRHRDRMLAQAHLCHEIASVLETRGLTQEQAASITGWKPEDVSRIVTSRFDGYSVWRLMKTLSALGGDILIAVNPAGDGDRGRILSETVEAPEQGPSSSMSP